MYYLGLDLGQAQDFTAIAIIERLEIPIGRCKKCGEDFKEARHHLRHIERFPLKTSYPEIVERVKNIVRSEQIRDQYLVLADATGVGRPVVDLLRSAKITVVPITITGGMSEKDDGQGGWNISKAILVSNLQVLLQSRRLKFADGLPDGQMLMDELLKFQVKITDSANDTYGVWREGSHDDLVLAVAMACWYSERYGRTVTENPKRQISPLELLSRHL